MKEEIIKWIEDNKADIRIAGISLLIINLGIIGLAGPIWAFLHIFNIVFSNICFAIPCVYIIKLIKEIP